jgi:hypothetical protein
MHASGYQGLTFDGADGWELDLAALNSEMLEAKTSDAAPHYPPFLGWWTFWRRARLQRS